MNAKNNNPLTDKEIKELELLDNPAEQRMGNTTTGMWGFFQNSSNSLTNKSKRKERVAELRTKIRMFELKLDLSKDWQKYYEIRQEEEKRFDKRFKDVI